MKKITLLLLLTNYMLIAQTKNYKFCSDKVKPCYSKIVAMKHLDEKEFWLFDSTGASMNLMWLSATSCGDDLKIISNDKRPIVKIFGIAARIIRKDSTVHELIEKNKTNESTFLFKQNDTLVKMKMCDFLNELIIPNRRLIFEKPNNN